MVFRRSLWDQVETIGERHLFWLAPFQSAPDDWWRARREGADADWFGDFRDIMLGYAYRTRVEQDGRITYGGLVRLVPRRAVRTALNQLNMDLCQSSSHADGQKAFGNFYLRLFSHWAAVVAGHSMPWVSKEPAYGAQCSRLFDLIPDARLIVLARDGRDVALSAVHAGWAATPREAARHWQEQARITLDALETLPADQWLLVRFEDLVSRFDNEMARVIDFFHLHLPDRPLIPRPEASRRAVWETEAKDDFRKAFAMECGGLMEELGYEP